MPSSSKAPTRAPLRSPFAAGAGLGLVGISLLGWFTAMRGVMHALLIALGASAPIPFAIVLGLAAVFAAAGLASAVLADGSPAAIDRAAQSGNWLGRAFFSQLRRQRRQPFVWGAGSGLVLGLVGIWLVLAALVIPLEMNSLDMLLLAQAKIDANGSDKTPAAADGLLHPSAWHAPPEGGDSPALDAFGRPFRLEPEPAGSYRLRSLGLDGVGSADDICVGAAARQAAAPAPGRDPLRFLEQRRANEVGWVAQVGALRDTRCSAVP